MLVVLWKYSGLYLILSNNIKSPSNKKDKFINPKTQKKYISSKKYMLAINENNQNQNKQYHIKRNDLYKNKLKNREKSHSKKLFKTGENFYQDNDKEKEKEKEKKEYNNDTNNIINEVNINKIITNFNIFL